MIIEIAELGFASRAPRTLCDRGARSVLQTAVAASFISAALRHYTRNQLRAPLGIELIIYSVSGVDFSAPVLPGSIPTRFLSERRKRSAPGKNLEQGCAMDFEVKCLHYSKYVTRSLIAFRRNFCSCTAVLCAVYAKYFFNILILSAINYVLCTFFSCSFHKNL